MVCERVKLNWSSISGNPELGTCGLSMVELACSDKCFRAAEVSTFHEHGMIDFIFCVAI
jgi:hypothetical protein